MNTSVKCFPQRILVPDANIQEAKSDYLWQLIVTPEKVAKKQTSYHYLKRVRGISQIILD